MGLVTSPPPEPICWIEEDMDNSASTAVDDMVVAPAEPDCEGPNTDDDGTKVYPIPADVTDSRIEECLLQTKSTVGRLFTVTVGKAARTIALTPRPPPKLMPGPALNKFRILKVTTFTVPFPEKRAKKLKAAWPAVASTLYDYSISCDLNLSECQMHVSTTTSLEDPYMIEKARHLLELLSTSLIPPSMALEIFQGVRQHETINIGFQQGGICSRFGVNKDDYLKRWECLFSSINALSKATCCHIFLDENTFTAVTAAGSSVERISQLKTIVQDCITKDENPLMDDPLAKHTDCLKSGPLSNKDGMHEVCSLYSLIHENRGATLFSYCTFLAVGCSAVLNPISKLQESLPKLDISLRHYGISYTLDKTYMILSTTRVTKDPDIIDEGWQLLELLSTTHVPASMAIELLGSSMRTCLIKIGNQEGGLSSLFGIKKVDYSKRWGCLRYSLQILAERMESNLFLNDKTVAAVAESSVRMIKQLVENCIRHNVCPGTVVRDYNCLSRGMINIEDPHVQHMEMDALAMTVMPEVTSFCAHLTIEHGTEVEEDWMSVELCLNKHGFSCKLNTVAKYSYLTIEHGTEVEEDWMSVELCLNKHGFSCKLNTVAKYSYCYMIVTKTTNTGELDVTDKIWDFLKFLSTELEPSTAIDILNGSMGYDFVPMGYSSGGAFCTQFGVTEEQYAEVVWPRIERELPRFSSYVKVEFFVMPSLTAVFGTGKTQAFRQFLRHCFKVRPSCSMRAMIDGESVDPTCPKVRAHFGFA